MNYNYYMIIINYNTMIIINYDKLYNITYSINILRNKL